MLMLTHAACKKEKADKQQTPSAAADFDVNTIAQCHKTSNPYPSQIMSGLEGTWVWQSNKCFWTGDTTYVADRQVVITFSDGALYKIFENGVLTSEGSFYLAKSGENWQVITSKSNAFMHGDVLLCKNELVFYSSFIDGCDFYFVRR